MAKPISFGTYQFRTKKSATEEARRRINKYEENEILNEEDELFFSSLFTLHSEYQKKVGAGIDYIKVQRDFHKNRCLYIHRIDGSYIDISWVHCIQPASDKLTISMAFRRAVKDRVMEFKNDQLPKVKICPILGIKLTHENSHVSYLKPTFDELLQNFLTTKGLSLNTVKLTNPSPEDTDQRGILKDKRIATDWNAYHVNHANLKLISAKANLRKKNKPLI